MYKKNISKSLTVFLISFIINSLLFLNSVWREQLKWPMYPLWDTIIYTWCYTWYIPSFILDRLFENVNGKWGKFILFGLFQNSKLSGKGVHIITSKLYQILGMLYDNVSLLFTHKFDIEFKLIPWLNSFEN